MKADNIKMTSISGDKKESPVHKKAKTTASFQDVLGHNILTEEREKSLQEQYWNATPYRHARIENVFQPDFLSECKEQIKNNSKVNFKETDLFRVYQSIDLANLEPNSDLAQKMPAVMQLRQVLYSQEWRSFVERVAKLEPGTLNNQVDCACNCHAPGCHLLCHDDVIGTRKVSYIIYLTEPDWKPEEGGALELYDSYVSGKNGNDEESTAARREPETCPSKTVLPTFNSMAFFVVEPGVSFHAVQEVLGERPRLSVQGWYHAEKAPENAANATLNRLKEQSKNTMKDEIVDRHEKPQQDDEDPFIRLDDGRVQPLEQQRQQRAANADKLLDSDRDYLALYINETYLTKSSMEEIRQRFEEDSSVQLKHFFRKSWATSIKAAIEDQDHQTRPKVGEEGHYQWGVSEDWKLIGPPHKQRYLQFQESSVKETSKDKQDPIAMALPPKTKSAGILMSELKQKVMQSAAFARYLNYVTSLGVPLGYKGQVRRFRPGLDYTVAHYGILTQKAVLDATICFAAGTGGVSASPDESVAASEDVAKADTAAAEKNGGKLPEEELDEADILWQSDDVGGFECYIEADDYESNFAHDGDANNNNKKPKEEEASLVTDPAEEYNEDDDTNLLSVSASNNTLSLVYRDPGTMRFIKYVGSRAPSSRWDVCMEYQVPEDEE